MLSLNLSLIKVNNKQQNSRSKSSSLLHSSTCELLNLSLKLESWLPAPQKRLDHDAMWHILVSFLKRRAKLVQTTLGNRGLESRPVGCVCVCVRKHGSSASFNRGPERKRGGQGAWAQGRLCFLPDLALVHTCGAPSPCT